MGRDGVRLTRRRVMITGVGLVTPLGVGVKDCWDRVARGVSGIGPIRGFDARRLPTRIAGEVTDFDPARWLTAKEVARLDRVQHFALVAAQLAVDDAGWNPAGDRCGVVVGSGIGGAATMQHAVLTCADQPHLVSPLAVPTAIVSMPAALVALRFGLRGPSGATSTACAASADALGSAMRWIRHGYTDACLAGGAEACVVAPVIAGFANLRALSMRNDDPTGACRPFDADRDGFVLSEGAAMLMLESARHARDRGAHVYAELCGYGQSTDAYHITAPDPAGVGAAAAITAALADADLRVTDIDYVNAHATATHLADRAETAAILRAFGPHSHQVAVSSTKSVTGHLLGAAGALEAAVCALAMEHSWVPPTVNLTRPDPECGLDCVPHTGRSRRIRGAMSNSFAFGGHNACLVFGRAPRWGRSR